MTLNSPDLSEWRFLLSLTVLSQVQFSPEPSPPPLNRGGNMRHTVPGPPLGLSKGTTLPVVPAATFVPRWCDWQDRGAECGFLARHHTSESFNSARSVLEEWLIIDLGLPSSLAVENLICLSILWNHYVEGKKSLKILFSQFLVWDEWACGISF